MRRILILNKISNFSEISKKLILKQIQRIIFKRYSNPIHIHQLVNLQQLSQSSQNTASLYLQTSFNRMNLLAKDKYRTKILQHVLQQSENTSFDDHPNDSAIDRHFEIKNHCQNIYSSVMFEKVFKQKPLISDVEDSTSFRQTNKGTKKVSDKQVFINPNHHLNNPTHKSQPKPLTKPSQIQQKDTLAFLNGSRPQVHLHKQPYTYHQKLPLMSVSNECNQDFFKKLKGDQKIKKFQADNKQNNPKDMNNFQESETKGKKYRFIAAYKVAEVKLRKELNQKKERIVEDQLKDEKIDEEDRVTKQGENSLGKFDETHRSKGSREMMDFLQSARDQLFSNMKSHQTIELEKDSNQRKKDTVQYSSNQQPNNLTKKSPQIPVSISQPSFKIQIQVSAKKSCQLNLTLSSDPQKISQAFILSNKQQLSTFTDSQIKKLQELLSKKIQNQIEKQKSVHSVLKANENTNFGQDLLENKGVNDIWMRTTKNSQENDMKEQQDIHFMKGYSSLEKKKQTNKSIQFSHVYIENFDNPLNEPTDGGFELANLQQFNPPKSPKQSLPLTKLVSFDQKTDKQFLKETLKQEISLDGYLNSPHELITYRAEQSKAQSSNEPNYGIGDSIYLKNDSVQREVSHFPISASISEGLKGKMPADSDEIGASKILSKSSLKPVNKIRKQEEHLQYLEQIKQQTKQPSQSTNRLPSASHTLNCPSFKSPAQNPNSLSSTTTRQINHISSQIISRVGKQNIIQSMKQKQLNKRQMILREKQTKEMELLQECSFKPKINNVSKSIDDNKKKIRIGDLIDQGVAGARMSSSSFFAPKPYEPMKQHKTQTHMNKPNNQATNLSTITLSKFQYLSRQKPRHQQLYANHKQIEARKQYSRQKSIQQISFKPQINKISKKIMQTKRNSLNNSTCHDHSMSQSISRHHSTCKKPQQKRNSLHCGNPRYDEDMISSNYHQKRKSMNVSRNLEGLQIGDYLYKEAMRIKKKKETVQQHVKLQGFRPLQKSQQMVTKVKEMRLTECFYELLNVDGQESCAEYEFVLKPQCINLDDDKFANTYLKYLVPLLEQLKQLDASLTLAQFIQSGLNLLSHLSQDLKAQFLSKRPFRHQSQLSQCLKKPQMNKVSRQLMEKRPQYVQDIYHRGVVYKKQIKEKREMDMEDRVRRELEKCTFKPKINAVGLGLAHES